MMNTPFFPSLRSRLAALGRRTAQRLRQTTLAQLHQHLGDFLPRPFSLAPRRASTAGSATFLCG